MEPQSHSQEPIFIVGCSRSGTSMLRDALRSHPRLAFPPESHFIPAMYRRHGNPRDRREAEALGRALLDLYWVRRWNLNLQPGDFSDVRTYRDAASLLFQEYARTQNKPRWGDKTPQYVMEIPTLLEIFPQARFIHIIRDGRDVALSWKRFHYGPVTSYFCARRWRERVEAGKVHGRTLPGSQYMEVRYEELTRDPGPVLETICAFLGESFHPAVLSLSRGTGRGSTPLSKTATIQSNSGKWKTRMSRSDRELFEGVTADLLSELGYETEGIGRPATAYELLRILFQEGGRALGSRLRGPAKLSRIRAELTLRRATARGLN